MTLTYEGRSDTARTQNDALDEVIELAFEDDTLRQLLQSPALRQIGLVRHNRLLWLNTPALLQTKFEKSVAALADGNADIKYLVRAFVASEQSGQARLRASIGQYFRHVLRLEHDIS